MKNFFITLIFIFSLFISSSVSAQVDSCENIRSDAMYNTCCGEYTSEYNQACTAYESKSSSPVRSNAEWASYCSAISEVNNQSDYENCCTYEHGVVYTSSRCYKWYEGNVLDKGTPAIQGGTQDSNSVYSPFTGKLDNSITITGQSSSPALKECSAIKFKSLLDILIWVKCVIASVIIPLIFTFAFLFFLWNVLVFMRADENAKKEEAKQRMGWGIIALFVMVSVWGIIKILSNTLGITPSVPLLQTEYLDPSKASR